MVENNVIAFPARPRKPSKPPAILPILLGLLVAGYVAVWLLCLWFIRW